MIPVVEREDLGFISYSDAWDYQETLFQSIVDAKVAGRKDAYATTPPNFLLTCTHPHVYTLGKSGKREHLLIDEERLAEAGATFHKINRGGDITYHGPGQVVVYPLFDLDQFFTDIHKYLRYLEEAVILTLAEYGMKASRSQGETGVWIDVGHQPRKICAMGVRASRWVTMHGLALNVQTDLSYFNHIVPCGIRGKAVTGMREELGHPVDEQEVRDRLCRHLQELFGFAWR